MQFIIYESISPKYRFASVCIKHGYVPLFVVQIEPVVDFVKVEMPFNTAFGTIVSNAVHRFTSIRAAKFSNRFTCFGRNEILHGRTVFNAVKIVCEARVRIKA